MGCIYCGKAGPYSDEHVLTRALAGAGEDWVLKDLVCKDCNALFSRYERAWTTEPGTAMARIAHGPTGRTRKGQAFQFHPSEQMFLEANGDPISYEVDILPHITPRFRYQVIDSGTAVVPVAGCQADVARFSAAWRKFIANPEITIQKRQTPIGPSFRVATLSLGVTPEIVSVLRRRKPADSWWDTFDPGFARSANPRMSLDPFGRIRFRTRRLADVPLLLERIFSAGQISSPGGVHNPGTYRIRSRSSYDLQKVPRAIAKTMVNYMVDQMGADYVGNSSFRPVLDYCLGGPDQLKNGPFVGVLPRSTGVDEIDQLPANRHLLKLLSDGNRVVGILKLYGAVTHRVHLGAAPSRQPYDYSTRIDYNGPGRVAS